MKDITNQTKRRRSSIYFGELKGIRMFFRVRDEQKRKEPRCFHASECTTIEQMLCIALPVAVLVMTHYGICFVLMFEYYTEIKKANFMKILEQGL